MQTIAAGPASPAGTKQNTKSSAALPDVLISYVIEIIASGRTRLPVVPLREGKRGHRDAIAMPIRVLLASKRAIRSKSRRCSLEKASLARDVLIVFHACATARIIVRVQTSKPHSVGRSRSSPTASFFLRKGPTCRGVGPCSIERGSTKGQKQLSKTQVRTLLDGTSNG